MNKFVTFIKKKPVIITAAAVVAVAVAVTCGVVAVMRGRESAPPVQTSSLPGADTAETSNIAQETSGQPIEPEEADTPEPEDSQDPDFPDYIGNGDVFDFLTGVINDDGYKQRLNPWLEGYVPTHPEPGALDQDTIKEIQEAYAGSYEGIYSNWKPWQISVSGYCGTYEGYVVAYIWKKSTVPAAEYRFTVSCGDIVFCYTAQDLQLMAYKDGEWDTLYATYENGLLTENDMKDILYYAYTDPYKDPTEYKNPSFNPWLEGYTPRVPAPGVMDSALKPEIAAAYVRFYHGSLQPEGVVFGEYFGSYNGCEILSMTHTDFQYTSDSFIKQIGGEVVIADYSGYVLQVYRDGNIQPLENAYAAGWISDADLKDFAYYYYQRHPDWME